MRDNETKSRGGSASGNNPAVEIKNEMQGFLKEFSNFQHDIKSKLKEQEDRLNMFDRKPSRRNAHTFLLRLMSKFPTKKRFRHIFVLVTTTLCVVWQWKKKPCHQR